ncbi:MAG: DUF4124 domain-containing protein [Candidatus Wenzhouxiangella sp. M2_3B_020]
MNAFKWLAPVASVLAAVALTIGVTIGLSIAPVSAQEIYKTVDENGNVVYTDQRPSEDAEPVSLPELTVVDPLELGETSATASSSNQSDADENIDFGLSIVSPSQEETIWNTAYVLSVQVATDRELPSGTRLAYLVDGEERVTTRSLSTEIEEVYRGEHQLSVELRTGDGETLGSAGPVTFYMRQHSRLHPNPN